MPLQGLGLNPLPSKTAVCSSFLCTGRDTTVEQGLATVQQSYSLQETEMSGWRYPMCHVDLHATVQFMLTLMERG